MLVLTRKVEQKIQIGTDITVTILRVKGQSVRVGVEAPRSVRVLRAELPPHELPASGSPAIEVTGEPGQRAVGESIPPKSAARRDRSSAGTSPTLPASPRDRSLSKRGISPPADAMRPPVARMVYGLAERMEARRKTLGSSATEAGTERG